MTTLKETSVDNFQDFQRGLLKQCFDMGVKVGLENAVIQLERARDSIKGGGNGRMVVEMVTAWSRAASRPLVTQSLSPKRH